ncbi:MAG: bifunctional precorrin-2 dehydrogenase/sirohydrochlorin ferrochelatase [Actinomycetia bacterium]|nr:bifunctional precorrin-2 dehydrogenase/sirohydrochlorin ferrochelatase [Actinomycetes bacterium]
MDDWTPRFLPVALDLAGRAVVVVGGGAEAEAKVRRLLPLGARVSVVSPVATPALREWAREGLVRWVRRRYRPGDLAGARVVFVADPRMAPAVVQDARHGGVLVNVVDDAQQSDFIAMASIRRGGLEVAVHTSGQSAALSRRLRERLEEQMGPEWGDLARVLGQLRATVRRHLSAPADRRAFWLAMVNQDLLDQVEQGAFQADALRSAIVARLTAWPADTRPNEVGQDAGTGTAGA